MWLQDSVGLKLKGVIVKNQGEGKGGHKKQTNLWKWRMQKHGLWSLAWDSIFVFQKSKKSAVSLELFEAGVVPALTPPCSVALLADSHVVPV